MWNKDKEQLYRKFEFKNFLEAIEFINKIAEISEAADHHPKIEINWNIVELWLSTHSENDAITDKDIKLSKEIDKLITTKKETKTTKQSEAKLFTDGGSRGNPGPSASGYVILDLEDQILETGGEYMGITTNNQAEYHALEMGLSSAVKLQVKKLHVYMDSMLIVNQLKGLYKVRSQELLPRFNNVKSLLKSFDTVNFTHVPRELNKLADAEVNRILDSQ